MKRHLPYSCCSVTQSCLTVCDPMNWSTPGFPVLHYLLVYLNSCPVNWWCHPTISSSVAPFSSCSQSFPVTLNRHRDLLGMQFETNNHQMFLQHLKMGLFGMGRELAFSTCHYRVPHASPHTEREGELFSRVERKLGGLL